MSKKIKIILIIFIAMIFFINLNYCYGAQAGSGADTSISPDLELGDLNSYAQDPGIVPNDFRAKVNRLVSVVQIIGTVSSVIALVAIGIKYMFSSIEEKADYKKTMMGYIVGCVMVFALTNLLSIVYNIANF